MGRCRFLNVVSWDMSWGYVLGIPSGNLTWLWKITIFNWKIHYKWPFSIAMLVYQRVCQVDVFFSCPKLDEHGSWFQRPKIAWEMPVCEHQTSNLLFGDDLDNTYLIFFRFFLRLPFTLSCSKNLPINLWLLWYAVGFWWETGMNIIYFFLYMYILHNVRNFTYITVYYVYNTMLNGKKHYYQTLSSIFQTLKHLKTIRSYPHSMNLVGRL